MPTDASGTPTSLGIPTFNVDVDAPSGLGFNAAMTSIDALIAARVAEPTGIVSGEVPVWNGSAWVRSTTTGIGISSLAGYPNDATKVLLGNGTWGLSGPKVTISAISGGPPASPSDGDIWVATGVDAIGTRWQFQYAAGSASAYKWEFIGGGTVTKKTNPATSINNSVWTKLASITGIRPGDYTVRGTVTATKDATAGGIAVNVSADGAQAYISSTNFTENYAPGSGLAGATNELDLTSAGTSLDVWAGTGSGTATANNVFLAAVPRRIS